MSKLRQARLGVIGAGGIANSVHLPSLKELDESNIVAICDLRLEKAEAAAKKFGTSETRTYWNMYEMLEKEQMDGVLVLVEPDRLFRAAKDVMMAGIPVLMEKPAGTSFHQADSLAHIAKEQGVTCAVAMNRRHPPVVQKVLNHMRKITTITQVDGVFMKNTDLGHAWDYASAFATDGIHALDLVRYMAGSEVKDCATAIGRFSGCSKDNAWSSIMRFENGVLGTLRSNYQTGARIHTFEIHGPGASAFINLGFGDADASATILYNNGGSMYSMASGGVGGVEREFIDGKELAGSQDYHAYYGYKQEDADFIKAILTKTDPLCTIADAAKSLELAERLMRTTI